MRRLLGLLVLLGAVGAHAEDLSFVGGTDKNPLDYKLNETITFTVTLVDRDKDNAPVTGRVLRWTLAHDDRKLDRNGTATSDAPLVLSTALASPGFVRLKVEVEDNGAWPSDNTHVFDGGAGADVLNIPEWPAPADFRAFWTGTTNTLFTTPYAPVCTNFTPADAAAGVSYFLFELPTVHGQRPATGILAMPEDAAAASCGLIATFNGYGFGATPLPNAADVRRGNIVVAVTRHGEDPVHPDAAYYKNLENVEMKDFCFRNLDKKVKDTDQYGMILRGLRALQYAKTRREWDGASLKVTGGSMGGYQALAMAGLDADVTSCSAFIPWHVDLSGSEKFGRMRGWRPDWTATMDYVDAKNFAKLVRCPVTFSAGLGDYVCPPSGEVLLFKNLPEPKKATWTQNMGHGSTHGPDCAQYVMELPAPEPEPVPTRELKWVGGGADKLFSNALNWQDVVGKTNAVPQSGDTLTIDVETKGVKSDIPNLYLEQIKMGGYQEASTDGEPLIFTSTSKGIYNTGYLHFDFPVALVGTGVPFFSSATCVVRGSFRSLDGSDAGIVKTGPGRAGINGWGVPDAAGFAGFRHVTIREGEWIYGINGGEGKMHLLPKGQTVVFDGAGATLGISQPCVFEDFHLVETDNARNKAHAISCQVDNGTEVKRARLTVTGTPPDDETVFTGTFETSVDFCWSPASDAKAFVLSGRTSTTKGDVEVARGTLRLTGGAGYSRLGTLHLSGGAAARLVVDTPPRDAFRARRLVLTEGTEKMDLAAGVTFTVGGALIVGTRLPPGVYTAADAAWLTGAGTVVVEGMAPETFRWVKRDAYESLKWSRPENWIDEQTGQNGVPVDGDTIYLPGGYAADNVNDLVNFRPRRIYVQGGYSSPSGNPVIFDGTDPNDGIYNDGFMYWRIPLVVNADAITLFASAAVGHQGDILSTDGHRFTVRKKGGGLWALQSQANAYTGFRRLELYEGRVSLGWQGFGVGTSFPENLDIVFAGENAALRCNRDATLRGAVIAETAAAANRAHRLGAHGDSGDVHVEEKAVTLALVGEPAADSRFTGVLEAPLSLLWGPANARTFTFAGASSANTTTNALTVTNGTVRLAEGATFTALGTLALMGGAATGFRVEAPPAQPFHAKALVLETGAERLFLEGGVKIAVDAATVGGADLPAGVYHATGVAGGTGVAWIAGGGYLCVGGADVVLPAEADETATARWTAEGGTDDALGTAANWEGAALPDLAAGSLVATFAAGTGAALDRTANFKGVAFAAPGPFALASAGTAAFAALGSRGLETAGTGKAYDIGWPLFLSAPQTWTVGAGDTLNLSAALSGTAGLEIVNAGTVNVRAAQAFAGPVSLVGGTVNVDADGAFGESASQPLAVAFAKTAFNLNGVTLRRPLKWLGEKATFTLPAATTNTIAGDVDFSVDEEGSIHFGAGASLRVAGDWRRGKFWNYCRGTSAEAPASLVIEGRLAVASGGGFSMQDNLALTLLSPSNSLGGVWFWMQGANGRLFTRAPFAFTAADGFSQRLKALGVRNALWDLCGYDQALSEMGTGAGLTITSACPATLHLVTDNHAFDGWSKTNACRFAGAASLSFEGTAGTCLTGASTSTGRVQVAKGTLAFAAGGSWSNAAEVVVAGGTLQLEHGAVFGRETVLRVEGGTGRIALDYAGRMRVGAFFLDGAEQAFGTYGAEGSGAAHALPFFTGPGVLLAGTAPAGTVLFFR